MQKSQAAKISCMEHEWKHDIRPRGILPSKLLASFGRVFYETSDRLSSTLRLETSPSDKLDVFLSHVWASAPRARYIGLIWYYNARLASLISVVVVLVILASLSTVLGGRTWVWFEGVSLLTAQSLGALLGTILLFILLFSVHVIRRFFHFREPLFFMDRCCIEQEDHALKRSEIRMIPQIINKSSSMLILLTDNYFTRLWCCYEMAVFTTSSEGSASHVKRTPTVIPVRLAVITLFLILADLVYVVLIRSNLRTVGQFSEASQTRAFIFRVSTCIFSVIVAGLCMGFAIAWGKESRKHIEVLRSFNLSQVDCSDPADRDVIITDIARRFGSEQKFEEYVRTEILALVTSINKPRIRFTLFAGLPQLFSMFGYINILSQRIGLYCMSALDSGFVPKDDSFCIVLDRQAWANGVIILAQFVRYVCFYPDVFSLLLIADESIATRFGTSKLSFVLSYTSLFLVTSGYFIASNWKFPEEQTLIGQAIESGILFCIFCIIVIIPRIRSCRFGRHA